MEICIAQKKMSGNIIFSFQTLPIELVYRILDNLDQLTILLSMRDVCTRLNSIIDTYFQYKTSTELNLQHKKISCAKLMQLATALQTNTTLTTLHLEDSYNIVSCFE
ncbi:hypothetical protein I4U23_004954 [Adineta vaga]|nr:hypothetical protein I4U23_004954 [Adineta vaga]